VAARRRPLRAPSRLEIGQRERLDLAARVGVDERAGGAEALELGRRRGVDARRGAPDGSNDRRDDDREYRGDDERRRGRPGYSSSNRRAAELMQ
jgi:hypothetical protein